jgi:SsrA-binding protein
MAKGPPKAPVIRNKKARFNYEILEKLEAGIALTGSEVKSLRDGKASLDEAFAMIREGDVFLRD